MTENAKINSILAEVDALDELSRIELLSRLIDGFKADLRRKTARKTRSITELAGLGAEIWEGVNPDEHVRSERSSWE